MNSDHNKIIYFITDCCSLGNILVACSEQGICAVFLGDDSEQLALQLKQTYPNTILVNDTLPLAEIITDIIKLIDDPTHTFSYHIDMQGTSFQQQVWTTLQSISIGNTISYSQLAQRIGKPKAVRAVANACGANQIAILIPCHRVVRADGTISGYRWGHVRKHRLIATEKQFAKHP
ncbi:MAG: methylated-DNA--[protein]-cysteine S-methyltransferase [Gammaproteobacteria bacterium]|nr:methylated-DNA--[protein]-cysteine S-methyltransferase [Gammaproteobacteria bacterium]